MHRDAAWSGGLASFGRTGSSIGRTESGSTIGRTESSSSPSSTVKVALRLRPMNEAENEQGASSCITVDAEGR